MITGITPQEALAKGDNEWAASSAASTIWLPVPQTCIVGYNNVRFDDTKVTRNIFYRNL
ncbi:hypothetical protein MJ579_19335 [Klebsiella pneumoniae]|nr:hypothetical protein MJ579_19335 [Klebsiella pneumoniae]